MEKWQIERKEGIPVDRNKKDPVSKTIPTVSNRVSAKQFLSLSPFPRSRSFRLLRLIAFQSVDQNTREGSLSSRRGSKHVGLARSSFPRAKKGKGHRRSIKISTRDMAT